ncbi:hypothetical protein [Micromonospora carbonacea]|uniref:hypothetical protein n=1 Tax=Micromonospora carbonacea TaxID=47853 RepID=UPI000941EFFA|nr:hypothetical protein [Micromonospora carbonacea]
MDLGPIDERPQDLIRRLEKILAGGHSAVFSVYGHPAAAVPLETLARGQAVFIEAEQGDFVALPLNFYESLIETLHVMDDADAMAQVREARAETGEDLSIEEVRRLLAERDE